MGGIVCARTKWEVLHNYEKLYSKAESNIILPTITITNLEYKVNEIAYTEKKFGSKQIAKVFGKFGVMEETFRDINGPFMILFDNIEKSANCKTQFLFTCLPFCKGTISEKSEIIWLYIEEAKEGTVTAKSLINFISMITKLSTSIIGKLLIKNEDIKDPDSETKALIEAKDEDIENYATDFVKNKFAINIYKPITQENFESIIIKSGNEDFFSSSYHRKRFLNFLDHGPI